MDMSVDSDGYYECCAEGLTESEAIHLVRGFESKHWGWWYVSIGIGFLLLAIVNTMRGAPLGAIALRIVIAVGFELLGWLQFRTGR